MQQIKASLIFIFALVAASVSATRGWKDNGVTTAKEDNVFDKVGFAPMKLDDFLKRGFEVVHTETKTRATDNLAKANNNNVKKGWTENVDLLDVNQYGRRGMVAENIDTRTVEERQRTAGGTIVKTIKYVNGKVASERTEFVPDKETSQPKKPTEPVKATVTTGTTGTYAPNKDMREAMEKNGFHYDANRGIWAKKPEQKDPVEVKPREPVVELSKPPRYPVQQEVKPKDIAPPKPTAKEAPKENLKTWELPKQPVVEKREPSQVELKVPVKKEAPTVTDVLNERGKSVKQAPKKPVIPAKRPVEYPERPVLQEKGPVTGPTNFYTKVRNLPAGHVPLNIKWELGPCKKFCQNNGKMEEYAMLKKLLFKAAAVLRMYIHVPETIPRRVAVSAGNACPDFYLPDARVYDAHLVMLGRIFVATNDEKNTIASSMFCEKDDGKANRAIIGRINFASDKILNNKASPAKQWEYINTIVHEVLHTLAFHSTFDEVLKKKTISSELNILSLVKKLKPSIYDDGHWIEESFPNDIMVPVSIPGNILSAASTELISHTSPDFAVNKKDLVYDSFLSNIDSLESFFKYRCAEDKPSAYPFFCSQHDRVKRASKCSADYVYMSYCGDSKYSNNCFKVTPYGNGNCMDAGLNDPNSPFMRRGPHARCFETNTKSGSLCLEFKVVGSKVQVILGNSVVECTKSGQWMEGKYYENDGSGDYYPVNFRCPDIDNFIKQAKLTSCPEDCNNNGFCSAGKCICLDGYDGSSNCKKDTEVQLNENMFSEHMGIILINKE